jgi:serine/threonine protein kinase
VVYLSKVGLDYESFPFPTLNIAHTFKRGDKLTVVSDLSADTTSPQKISSRDQYRRREVPFVDGTYILGKTIGQGSVGKVKSAKHEKTGELVSKRWTRLRPTAGLTEIQCAVKIICRDAHGQFGNFNRDLTARREAEIRVLLNHPYIAHMRDITGTSHHWYLLFEYVERQMLDYIISHGRLKERTARKFARQIGSAISYCHQQNIVHGNIKLENILVSKTGDIKLVDFCCSSLYSRNERSVKRGGSMYFAAPELLAGTPCIGPEIDVWAFGIILYTMVCGRVPFDDRTMNGLLSKITTVAVKYPLWLSARTFKSCSL